MKCRFSLQQACSAAHTVVEHRVALVGVGQNEIAQQVNGLPWGGDECLFTSCSFAMSMD